MVNQMDSQDVQHDQIVQQLHAKLSDRVAELNALNLTRTRLILEVYVRGDLSRRQELSDIHVQIRTLLEAEEDIQIAIRHLERYRLEQLFDTVDYEESLRSKRGHRDSLWDPSGA